ncbi:uncharacterized protein LOC142238130 [Haematobia irritans]|uniref:uncharacterized protein LOC142238130 n=1 Tax=Haematobia irritans TaxID=7368 RepID=UPI003F4FE691
MNLTKCCMAALLLVLGCVSVSCGKFKFVAAKGPFGGFVGLKYRKPKLLGLKHHLGFGHGLGGFGHGGFGHGLGGFHGGYEHHEYHTSHHGGFGGGWLGK